MHGVRFLWRLFALTIALSLAGCSFAPPQYVHTAPSPTISRNFVPEPPVYSTPASSAALNPARLIIPSIGIFAPIESLGYLPNGDLATPSRSPWEDVGWYNGGPHPGGQGSAVIDGHLDKPGGYPAVFWNLRNMRVGDEVRVMDANGAILSFRVTRIAFYAPNDAPLQDIFGNSGGKYLNLITCAGDWIPSQHQTTLRLVVYTSLML